jgi:hypothetical protein
MTAPSPSPRQDVLPWTIRGEAANDGGHTSWSGEAVIVRQGAVGDVCGEAGTTSSRAAAAFVAMRDAGASTHAWLHAWLPDGTTYRGDLWSDVLEYREVRMRKLAGQPLDAAAELRIGELDARLRARDTAKGRQFQRFECAQPTRILLPNGAGMLEARMLDVSAGGAKLEHDDATTLGEGAEVFLCVESAGGPCNARLPARVVWSRAGAFGLMFAGAPRWGVR